MKYFESLFFTFIPSSVYFHTILVGTISFGSGGGTTNLTWQAMAGIGKTFNKVVDASLTYRALYYDMKDGGVLQKTTMLGPQVAVTFKF